MGLLFLQVLLSTSDFGDSVEQVDAAIRKQEAFDKLLATQEEKVWKYH